MKWDLKSVALFIVKYCLGLGILYYLVTRFGSLQIKDTLLQIPPALLAALLVSKLIIFLLIVWRWGLILKTFGIICPRKLVIDASVTGAILNYVLPGAISGDVAKGAIIQRKEKALGKIVMSIFLDRALGLIGVLLLLAVGIVIAPAPSLKRFQVISDQIYLPWIVACVLLFIIFPILGYIIHQRVKSEKVQKLLSSSSISAWLQAFALTLGSHLFYIYFLYIIAKYISPSEIDVALFFLIFPLVSIATVAPITPGGLGIGQLIYNWLISAYLGYETLVGAQIFTISQIFDLVLIFIGTLYLFFKRRPNT